MNVRLVAYRRENDSSAPFDVDQYELDLQQAPNVVVNYNFLDLKNPDQRKASFSQTIKLPFSNRNNDFFENFFDVNLETLVYNAQTKFQAILYIDSVPQLKGFLQLKAIYLNKRLYEIALFGNTADFFTDLKDKRLQDAFKNVNETTGAITDDKQLDHKLTVDNIINSWTTGITTTEDTPTTTNDIMYPIIDYGHSQQPLSSSMFWSPQDFVDEIGYTNTDLFVDYLEILNGMNQYGIIRPSMLKPAIRIQRLFRIITQKAGYQIKSTFLGIDDTNESTPVTDTQWFSRLFMTLAPQFERVQTLFETSTSTTGAFVGFKGEQAVVTPIATVPFSGDSVGDICYQGLICNEVYDPNNMYFGDISALPLNINVPTNVPFAPAILFNTTQDITQTDAQLPYGWVSVETKFTLQIPPTAYLSSDPIDSINVQVAWYEYSYSSTLLDSTTFTLTPGTHDLQTVSELWAGGSQMACYLVVVFYGAESTGNLSGDTFQPIITDLSIQSLGTGETSMFSGFEKGEVTMYHNMPDMSQADFVKALLNRFNLIIKTDPDNERLLLIEPYQDFINAGTTKYWTEKLDVSKEQVVKSTNELQSKMLSFKDLEDKDFLNERYTKQQNVVYGERRRKMDNDFSNGEFSNFSVMSPFIAQGLPHWDTNGINSAMPDQDIAIAYMFEAELGGVRKVPNGLKPKLFYYSGTPIEFTGTNPITNNAYKFAIYSNSFISSLDISGYYKYSNPSTPTTNKFPLCLQYNLDNLNTGVVADTKIVNWTYYSPSFNTGFTFNYFGNLPSNKGFYNEYWAQYINEIYDKDARIMECYINLDPEDIRTFEGSGFQDTYFIKNCLWRVISIDNYLVGGNKSTKVKLMKVIERLETGCDAIHTTTQTGLMTWVDSATGLATTITNECCTQQNPNWIFVETNSTTGVGDCYEFLVNQDNSGGDGTIPIYTDFGFTQVPMLPYNNSTNNTFIPALMPNIENNFPISAMRRNAQETRAITIYAQATTFNNSTQYQFTNNSYTTKFLKLPNFTMVDVKITLLGTVLDGTNKGKIGTFTYLTLLVNRSGTPSFVGTAGGSLDHINKDSAFTTPSINITGYDSKGFWKPLIVGGANEQVMWTAKIELLTQPVGNDDTQLPTGAMFQNGNRILFEENNFLLWN